jgi:tripartite-type tricarboxylate transporter receptor subunit TctC
METKMSLLQWSARVALALSASLLFAAAPAHAAYPDHPIRWVVPFPAGGAMDNIARTLGEEMSRTLGQAIVVENRPGAGGNIGAEMVARSPADGYTLIIVANGMAVNPALYGKLSYDPVKDFAPVSLLAVVPNVLVANKAKTREDRGRRHRRGQGQAGQVHVCVGRQRHVDPPGRRTVHVDGPCGLLHIPYKGSGPAMTDLLGGQVDYMFDSITSAKPHIDSGKLTPIAVTTSKRSSALPNVPTMAEAGVPGYELSPWFAAFVPAKTPQPVIDTLNKAMVEALKKPAVQQRWRASAPNRSAARPRN